MTGSASLTCGDAVDLGEPSLAKRALWFTLIGGVCAATNNAVIILGGWHGIPYGATIAAAFIITTPLSYGLHVRFTFHSRIAWAGLFRYAAGMTGGVTFTVLALAVMRSGLDVPLVVAAPMTTVLGYAWNFRSAHWAIGGSRLRTAPRFAPR